MYLDFISDIACIGDSIRITCHDDIIEGTIVKIAPNLIAVKQADGSLVIKKDDEITDMALNPSNKDKNDSPNNNPTTSEEKGNQGCPDCLSEVRYSKELLEEFHLFASYL